MIDDATHLCFPSNGSVEMPFMFDPQLLRCTAIGPGGRPLTVLLDTGTDPSAIDLHLARRLGLRLGEFALGQDAVSNCVPFTETIIPWLRLGDLWLRDLFALALDLRAAPFQVDVVLGYNILRQVVLDIDYKQSMLRLSHPDVGMTLPAESTVVLPLTFFEHFPALNGVILDNRVRLDSVTIDTGSNSELTLAPDLADRIGLLLHAHGTTLRRGVGFSNQDCIVLNGETALMQLGPFTLTHVTLDSPGQGSGDLQRAGRANMGNRLLSRFARVALDYERRLCALTNAPD